MTELVLYTNPMSRGRIARWMLEEVGVPYRTEILHFGTTMKGDAYKSVNPMGKVPSIVHGKTIVTECAAICAYLADAFPQAGLAPRPPSEPIIIAGCSLQQARWKRRSATGCSVSKFRRDASGWSGTAPIRT